MILFELKTLSDLIIHHSFSWTELTLNILTYFRNEKSNGVPVDSPDGPMSPSGSNTVKKVWSPTSPSKATTNGFPGGDNEVSRRPLKWNSLVISNCCTVLGSESYTI